MRPYNWDFGAEVQRQIGAAMSVTAGYYRNWYGNFRVTDNELVAPADYQTVLRDRPRRFAAARRRRIRRSAALRTSTRRSSARSNNLVRPAKKFGEQKQVSNFVTLAA